MDFPLYRLTVVITAPQEWNDNESEEAFKNLQCILPDAFQTAFEDYIKRYQDIEGDTARRMEQLKFSTQENNDGPRNTENDRNIRTKETQRPVQRKRR